MPTSKNKDVLYKWVDENGTVHFSNIKEEEGQLSTDAPPKYNYTPLPKYQLSQQQAPKTNTVAKTVQKPKITNLIQKEEPKQQQEFSIGIIIALIVIILAFRLFLEYTEKERHKKKIRNLQPSEIKQEATLQYKKTNLMTNAERSFFGVLNQALGDDFQIFSKVRIADVVSPDCHRLEKNWGKLFNKISAKHFDFVICSKYNLKVECVIELNDSSHDTEVRKKRDQLVEEVCQSANVPLLMIPVRASYNLEEIKKAVTSCTRSTPYT